MCVSLCWEGEIDAEMHNQLIDPIELIPVSHSTNRDQLKQNLHYKVDKQLYLNNT